MLEINDICEMEVVDVGVNGEGIGRVNNFTFFVEGALPGDFIRFSITKLKKSFGFGKLITILKPSENRIEPRCRITELCGGCTLQSLSYETQLDLKTQSVKNNLVHIGNFGNININRIIGMENPFNYRNKARYAVSGSVENHIIGFRKAKTHDVADASDCCIQPDAYNKIMKLISEYISHNLTDTRLIRDISIKSGFFTDEIMVYIRLSADSLPNEDKLIERLSVISEIKSIVLLTGKNIQRTVSGRNFIVDHIKDMTFEISPDSFFQVNPVQTRILYEKIIDFSNLSKNETALDAFCGIGSITLFLARESRMAFGVEIVEDAIRDAKRNAEINNISNVKFYCGDVDDVIPKISEIYKIDLMTLDPPRKGCSEKLLKAVINAAPSRIVYVSCNPATLARDLKILCHDSAFEVKCVQPIDMFPWTNHVETIVLLQ